MPPNVVASLDRARDKPARHFVPRLRPARWQAGFFARDFNYKYYESLSGDIPVYNFVESLNPVAKSKVSNTFDLLTEYGIKLGLPHVKKITGTELWELRILGGDSIRIFYIASSGRAFVLLHGFIKRS